MTDIPDFGTGELASIQTVVDGRWGEGKVALALADVELTNPDEGPTIQECPAVFWAVSGCNFLIHKLGPARYRPVFFYADLEQFGTGVAEYTDLEQCTLTLLRMQADHDSVRTGAYPGGDAP